MKLVALLILALAVPVQGAERRPSIATAGQLEVLARSLALRSSGDAPGVIQGDSEVSEDIDVNELEGERKLDTELVENDARPATAYELQVQPSPSLDPGRKVAWMLAHRPPSEGLAQIDGYLKNKPDQAFRVELLYLRVVALALLDRMSEIDQGWDLAIQAAQEAGLSHFWVRSLIGRSMWWKKRDSVKSTTYWNQALAIARKAAPSVPLTRMLNLAGITQMRLHDIYRAMDAWELAEKCAPRGKGFQIDRTVALHNLGTTRFVGAGFHRSPAESIVLAEADFTKAMKELSTDPWWMPLRLSLLLQLAWISDSRDDEVGVSRWSGEFRNAVTNSSITHLRFPLIISSSHCSSFAVGTEGLEHPTPPRLLSSDAIAREAGFFRELGKSDASPSNGDLMHIRMPTGSMVSPLIEFLRICFGAENVAGTDYSLSSKQSNPYADEAAIESVSRLFEASGVDKQLLRQIEGQIKLFAKDHQQVEEGMRRDELDQLLKLLPSSGRLPCRKSFLQERNDHLWRSVVQTPRQAHPPIRGLYDFDKLPLEVKNWILEKAIGGDLLDDLVSVNHLEGMMAPLDRDRLMGSLHPCGFDKTLWQLTEFRLASDCRRSQSFRKTILQASKDVSQSRFVSYQANFFSMFQSFLQKRELDLRRGAVGDPIPTEMLVETDNLAKQFEEEFHKRQGYPEMPTIVIPRLEDLVNETQSGDSYLVIQGGLSFGTEDWYITSIQRDSGAAEPTVFTERLSIPHLLLFQFRQAVAGGTEVASESELVLLGRRSFSRLFPGEIGRQLKRSSRLTIVPSGAAWLVPYAALVLNDSGRPEYLGLEKRLSFVDSKATLDEANRPWIRPNGRAVVVSGVTYNNDSQKAVLSRFGANGLSPLPENAASGREIAVGYGANMLEGVAAEENKVREVFTVAPVIHIATHGRAISVGDVPIHTSEVLRMVYSSTAGIWLTPCLSNVVTNTFTDGLLQAWEVRHQLNLCSDLVVLAACDAASGGGEFVKGPDLPLAFLRAGARSVVAPLTRVLDAPTARLTLELHSGIRKGLSKDEALRLAMKRVQSDPRYGHPVNWASFQLFGSSKNHFSTITK